MSSKTIIKTCRITCFLILIWVLLSPLVIVISENFPYVSFETSIHTWDWLKITEWALKIFIVLFNFIALGFVKVKEDK